ncbi:lysophospholipid acyltransferase family protein [Longispora sp. NPDC051575]|uniref:lysophospholipid acyltransferase family protein n=1 Tax=Longispora sp. NPDC051575 TaxID=3154943 RepID=UPI0034159674
MIDHDHPPALGWLPLSPCEVECLPAHDGPRAGWARQLVRWLGVFALLLAAPFHPPALRRVPRIIGVRVDARGVLGSGELIVPNHVSWLDVLVLLSHTGAAPLSKHEVDGWPLLGRVARSFGTVFVDRTRPRALPDTVATLTWVLRAGRSVLVFPEGTTWCGARVGPFRRAAFQAAIDSGARIRPVSLRYSTRSASFIGEDTLWASLRRVIALRELTIEVTALPAIEPDRSRRRLALAAENAVRCDLGQEREPERVGALA